MYQLHIGNTESDNSDEDLMGDDSDEDWSCHNYYL